MNNINPEEIARLITDDPDVFLEGKAVKITNDIIKFTHESLNKVLDHLKYLRSLNDDDFNRSLQPSGPFGNPGWVKLHERPVNVTIGGIMKDIPISFAIDHTIPKGPTSTLADFIKTPNGSRLITLHLPYYDNAFQFPRWDLLEKFVFHEIVHSLDPKLEISDENTSWRKPDADLRKLKDTDDQFEIDKRLYRYRNSPHEIDAELAAFSKYIMLNLRHNLPNKAEAYKAIRSQEWRYYGKQKHVSEEEWNNDLKSLDHILSRKHTKRRFYNMLYYYLNELWD